jgi:hypothetical protein
MRRAHEDFLAAIDPPEASERSLTASVSLQDPHRALLFPSRKHHPPLPAAVPAPLQWTIERCLAKEPAERYGSTRDLYLELRGHGARITQARAASAVSVAAPKRRNWAVPAAALAGIIAAISVVSWLRPEEPAGTERLQLTPIAVEKHPGDDRLSGR